MAPRIESVPTARESVESPRETGSVAIRDLAERRRAPGPWLPEINSATGGPQSHVIYHDLVRHAGMRLKRTKDGHAMVAVTEQGAIHLLTVPSPEFSQFVDRFRVARRLRVLPESALSELSRIIAARVGDPRFEEDVPMGPIGSPADGHRDPSGSATTELLEETDVLAYALNRLVLDSPYVFVPAALARALGESERRVTEVLSGNRERLREMGFDSQKVVSSLGPVFLVTRVPPRRLNLRTGRRE